MPYREAASIILCTSPYAGSSAGGNVMAGAGTLNSLIDHSGEAERAGLQMRPTKLLIFVNPKAGTPWMVATPSIAIDLPMKILIVGDPAGKVWGSYNDAAYIQARHHVPEELFRSYAAE
jgi:uncharacterized protein (DUF302 family)